MDPKLVATIAGMFLAVAGVGLIVAQVIVPGHFANLEKSFGMRNIRLKTNVVGFGVVLLGVLLLLAETGVSIFGK